MTDETTETAAPILGEVDNGVRDELRTAFYTGPAGCRDVGDDKLEIAYFGEPPKRPDLSAEASFNGDKIAIDAIERSTVVGMVKIYARRISAA